ncbi:protein lin-37 homolog isoform X2 [Athalia rosae]|uniref:protein lin-37 homolog isoform X2 n=1 Tax=Athalia rosae TaxID=37344 RepID=UPI0020336EE0|nr:protein lin-37 homolog isoform X2 [Athalia rosae]
MTDQLMRGNFERLKRSIMGKKRSLQLASGRLKVEVKHEIGDNDVLVARDRLKGALRELLHHSDSGSSADSSEENTTQEESMTPAKTMRFQQAKRMRRRRQIPMDTSFNHTYVMKLFDRSVDLAQFREDTPLYPICRAWMANQPRNPNLVPKVRSPSPEILNETSTNVNLFDSDNELQDVYKLPAPLLREEAWPRHRVPSPIILPKEELNLEYEGQNLRTREALMRDHVRHWTEVRKKWHQQAHKNEQRFEQSANILGAMYRRAQTEFE